MTSPDRQMSPLSPDAPMRPIDAARRLSPRPITIEEAATRWGCSEQDVIDMIKSGKVQAFSLGRKMWRIPHHAAIRHDQIMGRASSELPSDDQRPSEAKVSVSLYVMKCGDFVKIGKGIDPEKRRADLQVGCPYPIEILAIFPDRGRHERRMHGRFADYRESGEWFRIDGALKKWIERDFK